MPIPKALSPTEKCTGSTMSTRVIQPIRCNATITANIEPKRSHSSGVKACRSLDHHDGCRPSEASAMSGPFM